MTGTAAERIAWLVEALGLEPHPEGGRYRRFHASAVPVSPADGRGPRPGLTCIHYLLVAGECSRWHRVASDEAWQFIEGAPLELFEADAAFGRVQARLLGPFASDATHGGGNGAEPVRVVPAGRWQAARPNGAYTLVACTVGPGFDFADFELLRDDPEAAARIRASGGDVAALA